MSQFASRSGGCRKPQLCHAASNPTAPARLLRHHALPHNSAREQPPTPVQSRRMSPIHVAATPSCCSTSPPPKSPDTRPPAHAPTSTTLSLRRTPLTLPYFTPARPTKAPATQIHPSPSPLPLQPHPYLRPLQPAVPPPPPPLPALPSFSLVRFRLGWYLQPLYSHSRSSGRIAFLSGTTDLRLASRCSALRMSYASSSPL